MKKKQKRRINLIADRYRTGDTQPRCPHFGDCGGCSFQDIAYDDQLLVKRDLVNQALEGLTAVDEVHPSPPYGYRNRMDMVTAFGKFGLRRGGSFRVVVDLQECPLMQEKSERLFRSLGPAVRSVESYDYLRHEGYLRYVVFREARHTGQVMVNFVTAAAENRLGEVIDAMAGEADSISLIHSGGLADLSYGDTYDTIRTGFIEETLDSIRYRITPNSFFQSNSAVTLAVYRRIREEVRGRVLDLCAGIGGISLFVAGAADQVTGVESNGEAVEAAQVNRGINGIENADFILSGAREYLSRCTGGFDTIVLDPPRTGMQRHAMESLDLIGAEKIVYMSCNPATFREDVAHLKHYRVESLEAYDMFPQTPHVELLSVLRPL